MAKVLLFDLDGTLLPMDTHSFVQQYIKELAPHVTHILEPKVFVEALLGATKTMMQNQDAHRTNEQVFEEAFLSLVQLKKEEIWPTLDQFYENVFPTLSHLCQPTHMAKKVLETAINKGYQIGIATNPVFPKAAIYHRLKWAGIDSLPFGVVTVYEECSFTKPHKGYYQEICAKLSVQPADCVMIGNDKQEDMAASQIGMKTFLVEGCVIDRGEPVFPIDDSGTLETLYDKLVKNEGVFSK